MAADLQRVEIFLKNHPRLELMKDNDNRDKVRCKLTNHELPCCVSAVETYTKGKKYQRLTKETVQSSQGYENYEEFLVPHNKKRNLLFCQLTKKTINNIPHHIEQHVSGRRFTKALAQFKASESKGEGNEDSEMWIPSDLDSESEAEEAVADAEDSAKMNESQEEEKKEENGDVHMRTEECSSDENISDEEPFVEEPVENDSSKAQRSNSTARRKKKQDKKRKIQGNSDDITPSKKAKTVEKKKWSSKNSHDKQSGTISGTKNKTPKPKKVTQKSGKQKV